MTAQQGWCRRFAATATITHNTPVKWFVVELLAAKYAAKFQPSLLRTVALAAREHPKQSRGIISFPIFACNACWVVPAYFTVTKEV